MSFPKIVTTKIKEYFAADMTLDSDKIKKLFHEVSSNTQDEKKIMELYDILKEVIPEDEIILMSHFYRHHTNYNHSTYTAFKKMFVDEV